MVTSIELLDRGRGLQLSTNRITVQDLVPYLQKGCTYDEILRWMPALSLEEISVIDRYYRQDWALTVFAPAAWVESRMLGLKVTPMKREDLSDYIHKITVFP